MHWSKIASIDFVFIKHKKVAPLNRFLFYKQLYVSKFYSNIKIV